jgi:hypothetical protein
MSSVCGVVTQGRNGLTQYVITYAILTSSDGNHYTSQVTLPHLILLFDMTLYLNNFISVDITLVTGHIWWQLRQQLVRNQNVSFGFSAIRQSISHFMEQLFLDAYGAFGFVAKFV